MLKFISCCQCNNNFNCYFKSLETTGKELSDCEGLGFTFHSEQLHHKVSNIYCQRCFNMSQNKQIGQSIPLMIYGQTADIWQIYWLHLYSLGV